MEPARDAPWAEHEKVYLLAEILKAAPISSHVLFALIRDSNIHPRWNDIALPPVLAHLDAGELSLGLFDCGRRRVLTNTTIPPAGRSVRQCQMAYDHLTATYSTPDYRQRPQLPAPIAYPGPEVSKKRPLQPETTTPIGRLLQPRPPHSYPGEFVSGPAYAIASPVGEPANKKKRGRPTKAEAQARADAAAARGEVYPPPRKARTSMTAAEPPLGEARMLGDTPPGPTPIAPMASTPQMPQTERGSESSSGKKKRSKPTPLELEKPHRTPRDTESPLAFGSATGDPNRSHGYSTYTPISGPLPTSTESRDRDVRMEGVEDVQPRTTTPHSFKDTVGI
ncbi:hypothetical protein K505DRAFT_339550 [Melanomma pulvis-pyrius CBS 109.77]|uniref:Uncharacterized protein n=1 Tax=Melanomma pulvis-pyrius CBS 109.77 TaxID=1314802 RepID=A0A6A6X5N5_9PLEO|nr:hypothetical protein K505DRAFT_339550 [Melanomma pulvis-pyrius CBS 109.77]